MVRPFIDTKDEIRTNATIQTIGEIYIPMVRPLIQNRGGIRTNGKIRINGEIRSNGLILTIGSYEPMVRYEPMLRNEPMVRTFIYKPMLRPTWRGVGGSTCRH